LVDHVAVISITNTTQERPFFNFDKHSCHLLQMLFDDVEKGNPNEGLRLFDTGLASKSAAFITGAVEKGATVVICHCIAGMSRSAGMAAAISKFYLGDDAKFFKAKTPNMLVYRLMLKALTEGKI
jgi:protein-tyrosine phosphatase